MVTLIFDNVTAESDAKRFKFLTQYASALLPLLAHDDNLVQENALIALSSLSEDNPALATQLLESSEEVIDAFVDVLRDALEPLDDDEEGIGSVEEAALIFLINVITCHAGGATIVQRYGLLEALFKGLVTVQEGVQVRKPTCRLNRLNLTQPPWTGVSRANFGWPCPFTGQTSSAGV